MNAPITMAAIMIPTNGMKANTDEINIAMKAIIKATIKNPMMLPIPICFTSEITSPNWNAAPISPVFANLAIATISNIAKMNAIIKPMTKATPDPAARLFNADPANMVTPAKRKIMIAGMMKYTISIIKALIPFTKSPAKSKSGKALEWSIPFLTTFKLYPVRINEKIKAMIAAIPNIAALSTWKPEDKFALRLARNVITPTIKNFVMSEKGYFTESEIISPKLIFFT